MWKKIIESWGIGEVWVICVYVCKDRELKEELCKLKKYNNLVNICIGIWTVLIFFEFFKISFVKNW